MDTAIPRNIVVSAVNIRRGGTLTVLRDCLGYLSTRKDLQVTALVHRRELCEFLGIRYIEIPWSAKGWLRRLWCEYVTMNRISRQLPETHLWLSLHDTTPRVRARRQAVYCQTSFPFIKAGWQDVRMNVKIPLFSWFTRYAYLLNVQRNRFLIVQQDWLRKGLSAMLHFPENRMIVAPPAFQVPVIEDKSALESVPIFLYPAGPDCHKNMECLCRAARLLENRLGTGRFRVVLTISGNENRYARWIKESFGDVRSLELGGYLSREALMALYGRAACLVFPSRVETWGLPISEFKGSAKPMLLADLPYAHESAAGAAGVAFFPYDRPQVLAGYMETLLNGDKSFLSPVLMTPAAEPLARDWESLFELLLNA